MRFTANYMILSVFDSTLGIVSLVLAGVVLLAIIVAWCIKEFNLFTLWCYRWKKIDVDISREEFANALLNQNGVPNVEVENGGFLFGNRYSHRKKKIFVRERLFKRNNIAGYTIVGELAGYAFLDVTDDVDYIKRKKYGWLAVLSAFLVFPFLLAGIILAFASESSIVPSLICCIIALIFAVFCLVMTRINYKTEKKAIEWARNSIEKLAIFSDKELSWVNKILNARLNIYLAESVLNIVIIIQILFTIIVNLIKLIGLFTKK